MFNVHTQQLGNNTRNTRSTDGFIRPTICIITRKLYGNHSDVLYSDGIDTTRYDKIQYNTIRQYVSCLPYINIYIIYYRYASKNHTSRILPVSNFLQSNELPQLSTSRIITIRLSTIYINID